MYLIIDDDVHACERLHSLLIECGVQDRILQVQDSQRAISIAKESMPELVFLDVEMPGISGFEVWSGILDQGCDAKLVCTTACHTYLLHALRIKAFDYLLKPIDIDDLGTCLKRLENDRRAEINDEIRRIDAYLSARQFEILKLVAKGKTSQEIGDMLFLSKHTVDTHRRNILKLTGCRNSAELLNLV